MKRLKSRGRYWTCYFWIMNWCQSCHIARHLIALHLFFSLERRSLKSLRLRLFTVFRSDRDEILQIVLQVSHRFQTFNWRPWRLPDARCSVRRLTANAPSAYDIGLLFALQFLTYLSPIYLLTKKKSCDGNILCYTCSWLCLFRSKGKSLRPRDCAKLKSQNGI